MELVNVNWTIYDKITLCLGCFFFQNSELDG